MTTEKDQIENSDSLRCSADSPLRDIASSFGFVMALFGWLFFAVMLWVKLSGATIYATTSQEIIESIDPKWEAICEDAKLDETSGLQFHIRIQGNQ